MISGLTIPTDTTQFTHTPGQVAFSPDGLQLVVTTKANGNDIDVFRVGPDGRLSPAPVVNSEAGTVPFASDFDRAGHLVVAEAGTNALATFALHAERHGHAHRTVGTGQAATCWVAPARGLSVRLKRRQRIGERLSRGLGRPADPARRHRDRPGHG